MSGTSKLMPVSYFDPGASIRLSAYADTVIWEQESAAKTLRAIRIGGYPEMVCALSDAIYGGAGIDAEIDGKSVHLTSQTKRYSRQVSHDGVYAEATLLALDDDMDADAKDDQKQEEDEEQTEIESKPRKCRVFCPANDREKLFEELDRKTAVPLIPEFREYVLGELERRGILRKLTVVSLREKLDAWVLDCSAGDANIIAVVEDGLCSGKISIPGQVVDSSGFDGVESVTGYLNAFGVTVAQRIRNQFLPLFDPAVEPLSPEILSINEYIREKAGYSLYDAQMAVAESVKRQLRHGKSGFIVAECGSGKTKIGAAALAALQNARGVRKAFNIVLCPSHVAKKWVREIGESLPDTIGVVVRGITEFDKLYALYERGNKSVYAVISKETARDGYMKRPAVIWSRRKAAFVCPDCMKALEMPISRDGVRYTVNADQFWFHRENDRNHKCPHCGTILWAPVNPGAWSDWVKIGGYGWVYRYQAEEHLVKCKNEALLERIREIAQNPDGVYPTVGVCRRYPLSTYIRKKYKGNVYGTIVDELHEYNNDSGQGDAMGEIFNVSRKVIGMTATLINGYSSGIFHLLYRTMPHRMLKDGKPYHAPREFDAEYGVVENVYESTDADYASNRRAQKVKKMTRQLPGVSPLVFSRFLLEHAAFLSLSDMGKDLPDYEEIPVPLHMPEAVEAEYKRVESVLKKVLREDRKAAKKILSAYLNLLTVFPDQPYGQPAIRHPLSGDTLVEPQNITDADTLGPKEEKVLEIVRDKIQKGEKVLIYSSWTRTDSQAKLQKLLTQNGFRTDVMTAKVKPDKREEWVDKHLAAGMQVMITNSSLVETGLDLNAFTTLIFYSMGYKLFTLRQASRRSWRINQLAPRVEVYMLYYINTMQAKAMKLMASKLAVAGIIEGTFSEEGLAAMSDVHDMTSQMAKELMQGIRDNVENIAASFKKMAIINPNREKAKPVPRPVDEAVEAPAEPAKADFPEFMEPSGPALVFAVLEQEAEIQKQKKSKKRAVDENQLSLFDFVA